jgi:transposase InsO family protein
MKARESEKGLETLCRLVGYTRQAYYQQKRVMELDALESEILLQEVVRLRTQQKRIGVRKLQYTMSEFRCEHSITIGRDAFFDLLRDHGMLVRKRRPGKPRTTDSCWWLKRYPNLAKDFEPSGPNQLWVSDITYLRLMNGFVYLSLITDAYSRKIVGHHVSGKLLATGCVAALRMALAGNPERDGLIHHSDRGSQYYSAAYMKTLGPEIRISMTERSDPLENAIAERVNGILKQELLEKRYESLAEARAAVAQAVSTYNNLRPHMSIDMLTPAVAHTRQGPLKRRWKNYYKNTKNDAAQAMASAIA